jgi:membrane protein YqaA with SNARE-associated domain
MQAWLQHLLELLALPQYGLGTVFVVSFISATLLPMGSEPAVFGLIKLNPELFWPTILVATVGNTLGGALNWWLGLGTHKAVDKVRGSATELRALAWLRRFGPRACLQEPISVGNMPRVAVRGGWMQGAARCPCYMPGQASPDCPLAIFREFEASNCPLPGRGRRRRF